MLVASASRALGLPLAGHARERSRSGIRRSEPCRQRRDVAADLGDDAAGKPRVGALPDRALRSLAEERPAPEWPSCVDEAPAVITEEGAPTLIAALRRRDRQRPPLRQPATRPDGAVELCDLDRGGVRLATGHAEATAIGARVAGPSLERAIDASVERAKLEQLAPVRQRGRPGEGRPGSNRRAAATASTHPLVLTAIVPLDGAKDPINCS